MSHISITKPIKMVDFDNSDLFSALDQWQGQGHMIPRFKVNDAILAQPIEIEQTDSLAVLNCFISHKCFGIEELTQLAFCSKGLYQRICKLFKEGVRSSYCFSRSGRILVQRTFDCGVGVSHLKLRLSNIPKYYGLNFAAIRQVFTPSNDSSQFYVKSDAFYYPAEHAPHLNAYRYPLLNDIDPAVISRFPNLKSLLVQIENSQTLFKVNSDFTRLPFLTTLILGSQTGPNFFDHSFKSFFENHEVAGQKGIYPALLQDFLQKAQNLQTLVFADDEMLPFSLESLAQGCLPYLENLSITSAHASLQLIQQFLKAAPRLKSLFIQSRHDVPINIREMFVGLPTEFRCRLETITIQRVDIASASTVIIVETDQIQTAAPVLKQINYIPFQRG